MADTISGGDKLQEKLREVAGSIADEKSLKVGFLEGATYPDGTSVPYIAAIQEFGGSFKREARTQTVYFRQNQKTGEIGNRFVKKSKSNFSQDVDVGEHTVTIPSRPFFRNAIAQHGPEWGKQMGDLLKANGYDTQKALAQMGEVMKGQLQESIRSTNEPPNAKSTERKKGFNNPLIHTGHMLNSVDYEVTEGEQ